MLTRIRPSANLIKPISIIRKFTTSCTSKSSSPASSSSQIPTVATSKLLHNTRISALQTPGLLWRDEEEVGVGLVPKSTMGLIEKDLLEVEVGGRETKKMNMYQAIRDAMSITLAKDEKAVVFGEDVRTIYRIVFFLKRDPVEDSKYQKSLCFFLL